MNLVLDSGALTRLSRRSTASAALITALRREGLWPPLVPTAVLVESLTGRPGRDVSTNRLLKTCELDERLSESRARRAAMLRHRAQHGSAVDAIVIATAEPGGTVLTQDAADLNALASHADGVDIVVVV
jgi:hypothetical protein